MDKQEPSIPAISAVLPNGSGAAAILSAGIGAFMVGFLAVAADKSAFLKNLFIFYKPTGPLSGVTTSAILIWLIVWGILESRWRNRNVAMGRINALALVLLGLSLLLIFPPVAELL
jgi:uncharacterized membrane protein